MKSDIASLKKKTDAGADYIVTQMFFDNRCFYDFVDRCREAGITVPIIPGLKILSSARQLTAIPKNFHVNVPEELVDEITEKTGHVKEIGIEWGVKQCRDLLVNGVQCVHFYVMSDAGAVVKVIDSL